LLYLFNLADKIRTISDSKSGSDWLQSLLSHKRAVLYFGQPSTRTYLSFNNACQILGIKTSDIRSVSASSESKGESLEDTLKTFHSYTDLIIIRHANEHIAEKSAWMFNNSDKPIPVINAGSGPFEHPTQSLLDIYTLYRAFNGDINGKTVVMSGDLLRGRTIRSLTQVLNNYKDIKIIYLAPEGLSLPADLKVFLDKSNIKYEESQDFEGSIRKADVFYATRIQDEYDNNNESKAIDYSKFYLKKEHLKTLKENCIILHPLPRRLEIDPAIDSDSRAWYWKQEVNGLWIRTALIAQTFERDRLILEYKD
jgi:aspartate carbamoyltransferase catalytic subunit